jgi:transcriptional regulator with XRE-family HTH domain
MIGLAHCHGMKIISGSELKALRRQAGITQVAMARELDMPPESLSRLESGRIPVRRVNELAARWVIAKLLGGDAV